MTAENTNPRHIAIIMDGNGRWARHRQLPRVAGHRRGVEVIRKLVPVIGKLRIPYLTLFAFSSENWRRPSSEVKLLIDLLTTTLESEVDNLHENDVRLRVIGDLNSFPNKLKDRVEQAESLTRDNTAFNLTVAVNYGGRWDITQSCKAIAMRVFNGDITKDQVTPDLIESHLSTHELPEPDLFIRTGGEQRISNFLLWQLAYTELYFTDIYWPDFDEHSLHQALEAFTRRQRRYGKTSEQVEALR